MPPILPRATRPWLVLAAKLIVLALLFWGIRRFLVAAIEQLRTQPLEIRPGWLVVAGLVYLLGLAPEAWFWRHVLDKLGCRPGRYAALRAYYIGHLGKYVPGKAMVVALRVGLIRSSTVDTATAVASVFYETLTMVAVGAALGGLIVAALHPGQVVLWLAAWVVALAMALPLTPAIFTRLARWTRLDRRFPALGAGLARLRLVDVAPGWALIACGWCLLGLSLLATIKSLGAPVVDVPREALRATAVVALATVGGFVSLVPGGAGVREALLIPLLAPTYGPGVALAAAVLSRAVAVVSELIISAILYAVRGRPREVGPVP